MSGFQITNRPTVNSANQQPLSQAEQSRSLLNEYKAHITTRNGSTKSGVMFIATSGNERLIKRDGAFSFRNRTAAEFGQATAEIKDHFRQAYQDKVSPQLFDKLMSKLDTYAQNRTNMMGTKSFTKFVTAFESAAAQHETQVSTGAQALGGNVARKLRGFHEPDPASLAQPPLPGEVKLHPKKQSRLEGVAASFGTDQVRLLGNGTASDAFAVSQGGKVSVVTVPFSGGEEVRMDGRHTGEMAAALARAELPHVAKPIAMVIRVGQPVVADLSHRHAGAHNVSLGDERGTAFFNEESYLVPTDRIEAFLAAQKPGASLSITAVQMPAGSGKDLSKVSAEAPLSGTEFKKLAAGMYMGLNEMHSAGLAHRDIKPGNLMFDRAAGEVMLIDLGSAQALDANGQTEASTSGMSELFTHPNLILADQPSLALGTRTDRYAFGLTLLASLAPDLTKLNPVREFKEAFNTAQQASPDPISGEEWLDALITSLDVQAIPPDVTGLPEDKAKALTSHAELAARVRDQLNVAFARSPDTRALIQKVLTTALPGTSADEAWDTLVFGEDASASQVLATLRQQDPQAARQYIAQLFSNAVEPFANNLPQPEPGQINQVTKKEQLSSKPDLSNSVTLFAMGEDPINLNGLNLRGANLLIRPSFEQFTTATHWGVDLSGADLENTHIELDLSSSLKEKIDSGDIQTGYLTMGLLQNKNSNAPAGPGGGGVVGMIASIPARFPALRVALTEQLLDFLSQYPSQNAVEDVKGWPSAALCVVALVDQFPELRDNPRIAEAAKRFALKTGYVPGIVREIKDPAHPSPLLVRCGLDLCLAVSPEKRKDFFMSNSESMNILFDYAERVDDSHPEAMEIKRLASELEQAYLETEPFASLSKPFTDYGDQVRILVSHDKRLNQTSALVIPPVQFQNMLLKPGAVQWDVLSASRFNPNDPLPPEFINAQSLRTDLPSLVEPFPNVKAAFRAPSVNAASRAIDKLFEGTPEVQFMMTAFLDRGVIANALGPEEVSGVFSRALAPMYEDFQPIYDLKRWPEARLKSDHLQQLHALAKSEGLGNNKMAFARYLFALSAALLRMSSYKGYGSDDVSVTSLRFYAHSLLGEANRLAPSLPISDGNDPFYDLQGLEEEVRSTGCAEGISADMITTAKKHMPYSSSRVLPVHLAAWDRRFNLATKPNENANLPDEIVY